MSLYNQCRGQTRLLVLSDRRPYKPKLVIKKQKSLRKNTFHVHTVKYLKKQSIKLLNNCE